MFPLCVVMTTLSIMENIRASKARDDAWAKVMKDLNRHDPSTIQVSPKDYTIEDAHRLLPERTEEDAHAHTQNS